MDERIKQEYHRIYSELYLIILGICCISVVVKVMFLEKNLVDCWLEYVILVGSPFYRFIRCRMLNVAAPVETWKNYLKLRLMVCLMAVTLLYGLTMYIRTGQINILEFFTFLIPFILIFLLVSCGGIYFQKRWQKKMDDKYRE